MSQTPDQTPAARIEPDTTGRWVWLIPAAAAIAALGLIITYVIKLGPIVTVVMSHGYGVKPGDVVRSRGIVVGQVESAQLSDNRNKVELRVRLEPHAAGIARSGSRFWVVRPRVSLSGVVGLETIAGPRYLAVLPGEGDRQNRFTALEEPPVVESIEPGGLELLLTADRRGSLQPGAPVLWRQVPIGTLLSVGLSEDSVSVEIRAYVRPEYATLIRENSKFWNASGVGFEAGFRGFRLDFESLQALVEGGISVATPDTPANAVLSGHRFDLAEKAENAWLDWRPSISLPKTRP